MAKKFDWDKFEKDETARVLSEMKIKSTAECHNDADESTFKSFSRASSSIIDLFAENTKSLR